MSAAGDVQDRWHLGPAGIRDRSWEYEPSREMQPRKSKVIDPATQRIMILPLLIPYEGGVRIAFYLLLG